MNAPDFWGVVERIRATDGRFAPEAYAFVMDGLDHTVSELDERRHVTAGELLQGLFRFARDRYGMMAYDVLRAWGIQSGSDVGEIVFQLCDAGILSRRPEDTREEFDGPLDLKQVLEDDYFDSHTPFDSGAAPDFD
ncbi:MAG TPA: Minf_1886 family protein [Candidatus Krumholzibacteria bacterium]